MSYAKAGSREGRFSSSNAWDAARTGHQCLFLIDKNRRLSVGQMPVRRTDNRKSNLTPSLERTLVVLAFLLGEGSPIGGVPAR